jgi:1-acyl-sn-glycerol-3-phosphate acyltransferase
MNTFYSILYVILWPFFNLFHPCKAIGREHIPAGGALVCSNHTTLSDPLYIVFAFQRKNRLRAMAKSELMRIPGLGWLLRKAGIFGVNRGKSDIAAIKLALKVLKDGEKLILFPEGTRHSDGEAKTGAAMLAIRSGVPIVPVYIPREKKWFRAIPVVIGEPYCPETQNKRATAEDYRAVSDDLMARIHALKEQAES